MKLILGRVGSHPFSLLVFIAPKVCGGVWDQGCPYPPFRLSWVGFYSHSSLGQAGPILIFVRSYTVAADSEIDNKNYVAINSKISSQLCRCRFRNRQPKTLPLPIQKSAAICAAVGSQKLCRCRFRNRHPKTFPLPIQKSAAKLRRCLFKNQHPKTVPLLIQKLTAWWSHFGFSSLFFFFFFVFTIRNLISN